MLTWQILACRGASSARVAAGAAGARASKTQRRSPRHYVANATKDRHPRETGDPCGIGPRFRGDDGVVCGACEPCGVCYIVPDQQRMALMRADWLQAATAGRGSYRKLSLAALPRHPRSIRVHLRHLPLICVESYLPWRATHDCAGASHSTPRAQAR